MEPRDLNEYRLLLAAAELRIDSLIEEGARMVEDLEAYKIENAKFRRHLVTTQKIIERMEKQVRYLERVMLAAQEIRLDFAGYPPEFQARWIHLPELIAALDANPKQ